MPNGTAGPIIEAAAPAGVFDTPAADGVRRPVGIEPDAEMDRIVADAEKSWKREAEVQRSSLLLSNCGPKLLEQKGLALAGLGIASMNVGLGGKT